MVRLLAWYGCRFPEHRGKWRLHETIRRRLGIDIDTEQTVERGGLRWSLNPADYAQLHLFWFGVRDPWEVYHLLRILPPEAVVLQAGANYGYYALSIATALGGQCRDLRRGALPGELRPAGRPRSLERSGATNRML